MSIRKRFMIGGVAAVIAVAAAGAALYYTLVPHDAPEEASLAGAVASLSSAQTQPSPSTAQSTESESELAGSWVLATDGESFVGYRVREELARIGTAFAVGRTKAITATLAFDGIAITDVQVTADLTSLASDSAMRDGQLRRQALETATYPTATFDLTQPIEVPRMPAEGETLSATAVGDLTLHGVTRSVSIALQGQRTGGFLVVVGSLDITFADFGIQKPTAGGVLSIEDHGLLELQLVFQQGTRG